MRMKKYMLVAIDEEDNQFARFYDDFDSAESARMDMSVMGGCYVEVYERTTVYDDIDGIPLFKQYEFIYA